MKKGDPKTAIAPEADLILISQSRRLLAEAVAAVVLVGNAQRYPSYPQRTG